MEDCRIRNTLILNKLSKKLVLGWPRFSLNTDKLARVQNLTVQSEFLMIWSKLDFLIGKTWTVFESSFYGWSICNHLAANRSNQNLRNHVINTLFQSNFLHFITFIHCTWGQFTLKELLPCTAWICLSTVSFSAVSKSHSGHFGCMDD